MPPFLKCRQLMRKPAVSKGYIMIKFYTNFVIKRGDSYVARHEIAPNIYVLGPQRERAIVFHGLDSAMCFLRLLDPREPDSFQIVPVKN